MNMYLPKEKHRVVVKTDWVEGTATVTFIDQANLYNHWVSPIQVELDRPYDDSGQTMYRCSLLEIAPLEVS